MRAKWPVSFATERARLFEAAAIQVTYLAIGARRGRAARGSPL
jgi:hypothetical protein